MAGSFAFNQTWVLAKSWLRSTSCGPCSTKSGMCLTKFRCVCLGGRQTSSLQDANRWARNMVRIQEFIRLRRIEM